MNYDYDDGIMRRVPASEFKTRGLESVDLVSRTNQPIVITRRGRAVVKLLPFMRAPREIFGCLAGVVEIAGDVESPVWPTGAVH
jgi:antitoxin (DNA-binding transcriptional repressor) of toxin-antitoxin stability system